MEQNGYMQTEQKIELKKCGSFADKPASSDVKMDLSTLILIRTNKSLCIILSGIILMEPRQYLRKE